MSQVCYWQHSYFCLILCFDTVVISEVYRWFLRLFADGHEAFKILELTIKCGKAVQIEAESIIA